MKKSVFTRFSALVLVALMLIPTLSGCGQAVADTLLPPATADREPTPIGGSSAVQVPVGGNTATQIPSAGGNTVVQLPAENSTPAEQPVQAPSDDRAAPEGAYNEGTILIKSEAAPDMAALAAHGITSAEPLYAGSLWYAAKLSDASKTVETVNALRDSAAFSAVDYDYIMGADGEVQSVNVSGNPAYESAHHFSPHEVPKGWEHMASQDKNPGGSADVIVAVIDTGVDYNHPDLRGNIWQNPAEIPDNGIDDDGNGYVDDVCGWNCVGDNNDPMDDNGHGTHVAGIVAAENNNIGSVGVAYNCKVMVLKAGNSSGYFNNSDIAEAIQYAYMNGASVINMSFGGSNISIAVEDALQNAYHSCILVAAAGNSNSCNDLTHYLKHPSARSYPAVLPYVIGVMSVNSSGTMISSFSNYDHVPYDNIEYEVYASGEQIYSTWPGNQYATLSGTSMASPCVAGIAALLRSYYADREVYSTKFIQSQIVNTGTEHPYIPILDIYDTAHSIVNANMALTQVPRPSVNLYGCWIDDSTSISPLNNGNGVFDAGETVHLYVSLYNRGGVASDVRVSIDTMRNGDPALVDPYFTLVNTEIRLSDIGTYSERESGDQYFEILVSSECPNDYLTTFNIGLEYSNGMDENDSKIYSSSGGITYRISRGYHLPDVITEDTVYTADRRYIVSADVIIPEGVTVTFEAGCEIQFYADTDDAYYKSPRIMVHGTLSMEGSQDQMIRMGPSEAYACYACFIDVINRGTVIMDYVEAVNLYMCETEENMDIDDATTKISNSLMYEDITENSILFFAPGVVLYIADGRVHDSGALRSVIDEIHNSYVNILGSYNDISVNILSDCMVNIAPNCRQMLFVYDKAENNIFISKYDEAYYYIYGSIVKFGDIHLGNAEVTNNKFIADEKQVVSLLTLNFDYATATDNEFSDMYRQYASQIIENYSGSDGYPIVDIRDSLSNPSALYPHVTDIELFNQDGTPITTVGTEEFTVRVTFNRPMDRTADTGVYFGTIEPYADYKIEGGFISDTVWEGKYTLRAQIENGQNYIRIMNACAAEDPTMQVYGEFMLHEFTIDTTAAMSMNLRAEALPEGIRLEWNQDDYDTLMGYNIYRSMDKDGNFVKINPAILLSTDEYFLDTNAAPGQTYWYTFTVVLSDFSESAPAGKVMATAVDNIAPNIYHTPINQGYAQNNLVISCTASDNIAVAHVTLYYRAVGDATWKTLSMSRLNDKYSATVFGNEVTTAGLEYYIEATDGYNTIEKGSAATPYTVVVKDASTLSRLGDVDGDSAVTTKDALMLMQCINGDLLLSDDQFQRADLNRDGILSSMEALRILQYINGNVTSLSM